MAKMPDLEAMTSFSHSLEGRAKTWQGTIRLRHCQGSYNSILGHRTISHAWQSNPRKFLGSYKAAVISAGRDTQALAKSFIMTIEGIAHDWSPFDPILGSDQDRAPGDTLGLSARNENHSQSDELCATRR